MPRSKIYAVKRGREIGFFTTWDICQSHTTGYPGAIYKSFARIDDAKKFMMSEETCRQGPLTQQDRTRLIEYMRKVGHL